jgi:hypothetical protein
VKAWFARALAPAWAALLCLGLLSGGAQAQAGAAAPLERQVKAAYLYRFAGFVDWPDGSFAHPDSALQIGVAGNDALAEQAAQMVAGRSVNGHPLMVRKIRHGDSLADLHILFVGAMDKTAMADLMGAARSHSVLTVSDVQDAASAGSMINFVVADDRLRFEVALGNVTASRLRISARMLAAAYKVQGSS